MPRNAPAWTSLGLLTLLLPTLAGPATAQAVSDVTLDANPQLFTLFCALRAAGQNPSGTPAVPAVGVAVDDALRRLDPEQLAPLRAFFEENGGRNAGEAVSAYISAALMLQPPPDFQFALPRDQLPPDVWSLEGLPALLRSFYLQAELESVWRQVLPRYQNAVAERQAEVARTLQETRAYLRMTGESYPGRSYTVYLDWLAPLGLTSARNYGDSYYLVVHPEQPEFLEAVRHQYLHFLLDPVTTKHASAMSPWLRLQPVAERAPRLPAAFRNDLLLLATESLVQAVELRLGAMSPTGLEAQLDEKERTGYIFTRHFVSALARFEQEEPSLRYYFPEMLGGLDVGQELPRLERVVLGAAPAPDDAAAVAESVRRLLSEGDAYLAAGNHAAARERFEYILRAMDPREPRALYGLAILASVAQDREQAKTYFLRALENAREARLLGWSHIYLGRIYDLEGNRQEALTHYRAALALEPRLEKVEQAARRGLEAPFGHKEEVNPRVPQF